jgi:hypothetical protein
MLTVMGMGTTPAARQPMRAPEWLAIQPMGTVTVAPIRTAMAGMMPAMHFQTWPTNGWTKMVMDTVTMQLDHCPTHALASLEVRALTDMAAQMMTGMECRT